MERRMMPKKKHEHNPARLPEFVLSDWGEDKPPRRAAAFRRGGGGKATAPPIPQKGGKASWRFPAGIFEATTDSH